MAKHTKPPMNRPTTQLNATGQPVDGAGQPLAPSDLACGTVVKVLTALDEHITHETAELRDFHNPDKADAMALLGVKVSQMQEAQRKHEAEKRKASSKLTPGAVRAYLQALTKEEWASLSREVDSHFRGGSVLA